MKDLQFTKVKRSDALKTAWQFNTMSEMTI